MGMAFSPTDINQDIITLTMLIASIIITFFGARFFKYIVFFIGFVAFGLLTYLVLPEIFAVAGASISPEALLYTSLAVGALCGILLVVIYKAAVFTVGAIFGLILWQCIWTVVIAVYPNIPEPVIVQLCGFVVFALLGAFFAFKLVKQVLKGITSFIGGFMFATSIAYFIQRIDRNETESDNFIEWVAFFATKPNNGQFSCDGYCIGCILIWLAMFAGGCFVQYKMYKKKKNKKDKYDDSDSTSSEDSSSDDDDSDDSGRGGKKRKGKKKRRKGKKKKRRRKQSDSDSVGAAAAQPSPPMIYSPNHVQPYNNNDGGRRASEQGRFAGSVYGVSSARGGLAPNSQYGGGHGQRPQYAQSAAAMSNYGRQYYQQHEGPQTQEIQYV